MTTQEINVLIQSGKTADVPTVKTDSISDGYHTFGQLYDHRITLYIAFCYMLQVRGSVMPWRYKESKDWFILGIPSPQITYHLPMSRWEECNFADTRLVKPEFDGHNSDDVIDRIKSFYL